MSEFNLPLLRKGVEWVESENRKPKAESEWYQGYYAVGGLMIERTCGTAHCLAGFIAEQDGGHRIDALMIDGDYGGQVAIDLLGITNRDAWGDDDAFGLFTAGNTVEEIREIAETIARRYGEEL